ncbi:hypothetical protein [Rubritalea tangerina]|uniref:hypothetical protein n=1 Tax=Rubritalea tangerina TaxID=430798 RepID=UPI0036243D29
MFPNIEKSAMLLRFGLNGVYKSPTPKNQQNFPVFTQFCRFLHPTRLFCLHLNTQHSTLNTQHSTLNTQHSTLNTQHSTHTPKLLTLAEVDP